MSIFDLEHLHCGYPGKTVLPDCSFKVENGEFIGMLGPNGAGKSTLLKNMAGVLVPFKGEVKFYGRNIAEYSRKQLAEKLAVIYQDFECVYDFSVEDIVLMGRTPYMGRFRSPNDHDWLVVNNVLEMADLSKLRYRNYNELSGGEAQRVLIAKALAQEPKVLLLDEPSNHLDISHQIQIFDMLRLLNSEQKITIICTFHDLTLAAQYIKRAILLESGKIRADGPPAEIITKETIKEIYKIKVDITIHPFTKAPVVYPISGTTNAAEKSNRK